MSCDMMDGWRMPAPEPQRQLRTARAPALPFFFHVGSTFMSQEYTALLRYATRFHPFFVTRLGRLADSCAADR